ncbi:hypothetical protein FQN54_001458 [Arachnomyces sp. PD_36]|nr:hypothetical protein FQN54_001458 [Arachnomyces sp. PD_36]
MSPKILVVVGITGNQGGSVANQFLPNPSWRLRALVRDPTKPSAQSWQEKGVDLVRGDLDDVESLKAAFAGAHAIFAMTDYWVPMSDERNIAKAKEQGISINEFCYKLELQRGKNMAVAASTVSSLERYVYSALGHTTSLSKGKYPNVWHFDSKAEVERYIRQDPEMADLAKKSSFLHVGLYVDNWKKMSALVPAFVKDKSSGKWYHPDMGDGNMKFPFVWTQKDTGVLFEALLSAEPGKSLLGYSQSLTWREFMQIWAKCVGVELLDGGFKSIAYDEAFNTIQADNMKAHLADIIAYAANLGYDGGDRSVVRPEELKIENKLTPIEEYFKQEDWSSIL